MSDCLLAEFLRAAGPVRAPLRACCLVALVDGGGRAPVEGRECQAARAVSPISGTAFPAVPGGPGDVVPDETVPAGSP